MQHAGFASGAGEGGLVVTRGCGGAGFACGTEEGLWFALRRV